MSSTERIANEMDLQIFNLMSRADRLASDSRIKGESEAWEEVGRLLSSARNKVRRMMHPADVEKTRNS